MTVEECINDAATLGGYQFAGLTVGGKCFFADNETSGAQTTSQSNCLSACRGNSAEACGGSGSVLIYQDTAWVVEEPPQLASDLQALEAALATLQQDLQTWTNLLNQYQASLSNGGSSKLRRAMSYGGRLLSRHVMGRDSTPLLFQECNSAQSTVVNQDVPRVQRLLNGQTGSLRFPASARYQRISEQDENSFEMTIRGPFQQAAQQASSSAATIPAEGADASAAIAATGEVATTVGAPAISTAGKVATGIFLGIGILIIALIGTSSPPPPPPPPPPSSTFTTTTTTTTTSSSSTSTCTACAAFATAVSMSVSGAFPSLSPNLRARDVVLSLGTENIQHGNWSAGEGDPNLWSEDEEHSGLLLKRTTRGGSTTAPVASYGRTYRSQQPDIAFCPSNGFSWFSPSYPSTRKNPAQVNTQQQSDDDEDSDDLAAIDLSDNSPNDNDAPQLAGIGTVAAAPVTVNGNAVYTFCDIVYVFDQNVPANSPPIACDVAIGAYPNRNKGMDNTNANYPVIAWSQPFGGFAPGIYHSRFRHLR
jgi:hypothetical protein